MQNTNPIIEVKKITAGIIGGTGYTGVELIRLLSTHSQVDLSWITSRSEAGTKVADIFLSLRGVTDLVYQNFDDDSLAMMTSVDVVFFATPHGVAMQQAPELIAAGVKVIDLGADFRLQSLTDFEQWYAHKHSCPELLKTAVYGLPEVNRDKIRTANLVANPGCYPTTAILGLKPIIHRQNLMADTDNEQNQSRLIDSRIIIDAKSGVSGAGRQGKLGFNYSETSDNFKAYGVDGHRHLPEIEQGVDITLASNFTHNIRFLPHLVPMIRGMFSSIHMQLTDEGCKINWQEVFESSYAHEMFVDVLPVGVMPDTRSVRASNCLRISVHQNNDKCELTVLVVQDNLVKGAAGQAVQNMNVMFGYDEKLGLTSIPIVP